MNKYLLSFCAAALIATAPAYYAFQAQAEEMKAAPVTEEVAAIDCTAIPDDQDIPAECAGSAEPAAGDDMPTLND